MNLRGFGFHLTILLLGSFTTVYKFKADVLPLELPDINKDQLIKFELKKDRYNKLLKQLASINKDLEDRSVVYTLDRAIEKAIINNPSLEAKLFEIQHSEYSYLSQVKDWSPSLSLIPRISYTDKTTKSADKIPDNSNWSSTSTTVSSTISSSINPSLSWTFLSPTRQPSINRAKKDLESQRLNYEYSARQLIFNVESNFTSAQNYKALINAYTTIQKLNQENYYGMLEKYKSGYASILDVNQQYAQLLLDLSSLINYTNQYVAKINLLSKYIGLQDNQLIIPNTLINKKNEWDLTLEDTIKHGIENNEQIKSLEKQSESAFWQAKVIKNGTRPMALLGISYPIDWYLTDNDYSNHPTLSASNGKIRSRSQTPTINLSMNWNFYDGGKARFASDSMLSYQKSIKSNIRSQKNILINDIKSNYSNYVSNLLVLESTKLSYESSFISEDAASKRQIAGLSDGSEMISAVVQLGQAALQSFKARNELSQSVSRLHLYSAIWPRKTKQLVNQRINSFTFK